MVFGNKLVPEKEAIIIKTPNNAIKPSDLGVFFLRVLIKSNSAISCNIF